MQTSTSFMYIQEVWRRRHFWLSLAKLDLEARYHNTLLGMGWSLLHPIAMTTILCFVFSSLFSVELRTYIPFLLSGMAAWMFLSGACIEGCGAIRQSEKFLRAYPAPIAIYALRSLCAQLFHFLIVLATSIAMSWLLLGFHNPLALLSLIPALTLLAVYGVAIILICGIFDSYFPDCKHLIQILVQFIFYLLPIMYPKEAIRAPLFQKVLYYNPLSSFVSLIRDPIIERTVPSAQTWATALVTTCVVFAIAVHLVRRTERHIIFQL